MGKKASARMSHKNLLRRLSHIQHEVEAGTVFVPEEGPIALESPLDLAAASQLGLETILFFDWGTAVLDSDAEGWFGRLAAIPLAANSAAVTWEGPQAGLQIIARLAPGQGSKIWSAFLHQFLGENGEGFGVRPLPVLPSRLTNYRPDFILEEGVRAALQAYVESTEQWATMRTLVAEGTAAPGPDEKEALLDAYFAVCYEEELQ